MLYPAELRGRRTLGLTGTSHAAKMLSQMCPQIHDTAALLRVFHWAHNDHSAMILLENETFTAIC